MSDDAERRAAIRLKVELPVTYRVGNGPERVGTIDNISRAGLLLVAGEAIVEGSRLSFVFEDNRKRKHTVIGEVVRSAPIGKLGVSFIHIEEETLNYVRSVLGVP